MNDLICFEAAEPAAHIGLVYRVLPGPHDSIAQTAALALATRLEQYSHDRGYSAARFWTVPVWERFAKIVTYDMYRVKCNIVNGLPTLL